MTQTTCSGRPVQQGTHKPAGAVHQIAEPHALHPDDAAVDSLSAAMKAKLAKQRARGYGGWDTDCTQQRLSDMLRAHVTKGDPVDAANFCAFLIARGEGIAPAAPAAQAVEPVAIAEITSASHDAAEFGERGLRLLADFQHLEYGTKLYAHATPPEPEEATIELMKLVDAWHAEMRTGNHISQGMARQRIVMMMDSLATLRATPPAPAVVAVPGAQTQKAAYEQYAQSLVAKYGFCNWQCEEAYKAGALAAPQAQDVQRDAVAKGEVLVVVTGYTGSGKSAIAGEIEIMCRALGLQVEWPDGVPEKNMTGADWQTALELYKPRVRIVERNVPGPIAASAAKGGE